MTQTVTRTNFRYDLTNAELDALSDDLRVRYSDFLARIRRAGHSFACIAVDGQDPLANIGRALEQRVFDEEAGDHSPDVMHSEYGAYEDRSVFFLGYDLNRHEVAGCSRGITGTAGFGPMVKTMRDCLYIESYRDLGLVGRGSEIDLREHPVEIDPEVGIMGGHRNPAENRLDRRYLESYHVMEPGDGILDMATVVVPKGIREGATERLSLLLYACSWRAALHLGLRHAVTFIRQDLLEGFRSRLHMPWEDLGGLGGTQYVPGDPFLSQPAYAHLEGFRHVFAREILRGEIGLEQKAGPPFDHFVDLMISPQASELFLFE